MTSKYISLLFKDRQVPPNGNSRSAPSVGALDQGELSSYQTQYTRGNTHSLRAFRLETSACCWLGRRQTASALLCFPKMLLIGIIYTFSQVTPGKGRVTKLSAPPPPPPPPVAEESSVDSTSTAYNASGVEIIGVGVEADYAEHTGELSKRELAQQRRSLLMKLFADTGTAKIPAVLR